MPQAYASCRVEPAHGSVLQAVSQLVQREETEHYLHLPILWRDVKMNSETRISGRIVAAARALAGISREDFAVAARISVDAIALIEASGSAWLRSENDAEAVSRAFEKFGVMVIDEADGMGAGVRLKFTRRDVNQIARLEGEGGIVRSDDAP
jgi:hypothetical protein